MKISQMSVDSVLDALCEVTPYISNIVKDKEIFDIFAEKMNTKEMTAFSVAIVSMDRYNSTVQILMKTHRDDIYGILSVLNQKSKEEIMKQSVMETMEQLRDLFQDEELLSFFKSFMPQGKKKPSALSADCQNSAQKPV